MSKVTLSWKKEMKGGAYTRSDSVYRNFIKRGDERYPPEKGRYCVYHCYACPWATRVVMAIKLKGLEDVIKPVSIVHSNLAEGGWRFPTEDDPCEGSTPDLVHGKRYLREIYEMSHGAEWEGKVTVPVLFDTKTNTIVNNESAEILRMLNSEFNEFAKYPDIDLYPEHLREQIDTLNHEVYHNVNNGVYKCGFSTSQSAYEEAFTNLFGSLDKLEDILSKNRYLMGSEFTEADVRLFSTLVRFDPVYHNHFRCNKKKLKEYPNLWNYHLEIAQMPWVKPTINMKHIKDHYYGSHKSLNPSGIIPVGPDLDLNEKHDRERFKSDSPWTNHESTSNL